MNPGPRELRVKPTPKLYTLQKIPRPEPCHSMSEANAFMESHVPAKPHSRVYK